MLPVAFYPVLSRLFSHEDYAMYGLFFSVFSFLEIASAGRYDFGIVMPEKDDDAMNLVVGGLLISFAYSLLILSLLFPLKDVLSSQLGNPQLANWLFLIPMSLVLMSVTKLGNSWLLRKKEFRAASINKASQKISEVSSQLTLGLLRSGNGLIIGDVVGRTLSAIVSLVQTLRSGFDLSKINRSLIKANLLRFAELPKYGIVPSMLNSLGGLLPVFIVSSYYSVDISGSFNFSRIVLSVPFALIATGISQVLMQEVSERKHFGLRIGKEMFSLVLKLAVLSLLALAVLYFFAPPLFVLVFGLKWRVAGEYTSILMFSTAISFVVSPFSILLVILGRIRLLSLWQALYFVSISLLWLIRDSSIENFLIALTFVDGVCYLIYGTLIFVAIKGYDKSVSKDA